MTAAKKKSDSDETPESPSRVPSKVTPTKPSEMSDDLVQFITAIDEYKRTFQRPFPSWGEVLQVLKSLGYERS
jgi:hypothetical protein